MPTPSEGPRPPRVLVVDDDPAIHEMVRDVLRARGYGVVGVTHPDRALAALRAGPVATLLLDINMPGGSGLDLLPRVRTEAPDVSVIMLTAQSDVATVVQAMRLGAYDYLAKPFQLDQLVLVVARAVERWQLTSEVDTLRRQLLEESGLRELMGPSAAVGRVIAQVEQVARSGFTVLIQGETGTGKELVARALHRHSERHAGPFVPVDCGAIPETLIESELFGHERGAFTGAAQRRAGQFALAQGGTLFLDEISNLPMATQAKLLRVLQERVVRPLGAPSASPIDVRVVAAANVALDAEVAAGRFRQDLYYRLGEFTITLPPLRERADDIVPLATRFLVEARMELKRPVRGFSPEATDRLLAHPWPGNVRELRNVVRRSVLLGEEVIDSGALGLGELPPSAAPSAAAADLAAAGSPAFAPEAGLPLREVATRAAEAAERWAIRQALQTARGNKSEAARLLHTDFKTLHAKMRRYGIDPRGQPET